jgi:Ca2+-binding EF-hand superfamily protein
MFSEDQKKEMEILFKKVDNNGVIKIEEFISVLKKFIDNSKAKEAADIVMSITEKDNNNTINWKEFLNYSKENKNGNLIFKIRWFNKKCFKSLFSFNGHK